MNERASSPEDAPVATDISNIGHPIEVCPAVRHRLPLDRIMAANAPIRSEEAVMTCPGVSASPSCGSTSPSASRLRPQPRPASGGYARATVMASAVAVGGVLPAGLLTVFGAVMPGPSSWSHSPGMDSSGTADVGAPSDHHRPKHGYGRSAPPRASPLGAGIRRTGVFARAQGER